MVDSVQDDTTPEAAETQETPTAPASPDSVGESLNNLWVPVEASGAQGPEAILLSTERITAAQLTQAQNRQEADPRLNVLEALVQIGVIDATTSLQAAAEYFNLPFKRVVPDDVDADAMRELPLDYIQSRKVLPLTWEGRNDIVVAISDPADIFLIDDLRERIKATVQLVVTPPADIDAAIESLSTEPLAQVDDIVAGFDEDSVELMTEEEEDDINLEQMAGESPVIRYVNFLISSSVTQEASDIHIEPGEKRLRVRFRVDGILFEQTAPPLQMHSAIISRIKIMANLDISERRLPQDGRIRVTVQRRSIDLRVSMLPTVHGEKCVIRLLDNRSISVGLESLGFQEDTLKTFSHHILQPHGVVLVTGPTGSGKSTTLYSALQIMDRDKLNISTVEDPVEYELGGINQVNVIEGIGMTFAAALRSLLRQDPDVVMVGEVRDPETARIAVQAALTGHLVLSTLHTNDAPSSVVRLINIGVEPFLISAALNAILAQRLVRRICPNCAAPVDKGSAREMEYLKRIGRSDMQLTRGKGCERCRNTGYKGRVGLYELLVLSDQIRDLIPRNPSIMDLKRVACEEGMRTLQEDGLDKVALGRTTVEEIIRVTET